MSVARDTFENVFPSTGWLLVPDEDDGTSYFLAVESRSDFYLECSEGCYPIVLFKNLIQISLLKQVTRRSRHWSNSGQGSPNGAMVVLIVSIKPSLMVFSVLNSPAMLKISTSTTSSSS